MESQDFLIRNVRLWRAGNDALEPLTSFLRVREGRLAEIGADPGPAGPASRPGEVVRDGAGRIAVPGLIDAHVHLELDPGLRSPREQLAVPVARRRRAMAGRAARMLAAGITTARDCGGGLHLEHALRDAIVAGASPGPRLLCCGQPLTTPEGHCAFWGGIVASPADVGPTLERQLAAGSDWIKVMATGGVFTPGSRARDAQFDARTLAAIVDAAARADRAVAAHCHGTEGIARAVRAGVRTIEHASFAGPDGFGTDLDDGVLRSLAEREVWVSPTVNAGWGRRIEDEGGAPTDFFRRLSSLLRRQRDAGVRFIASTDAGIPGVEHDALVDGLVAFARFADLRPVDVLRAATAASARALGLERETGRLEEGLSADLLLLDADPLEDLTALRDPAVVVQRGAWLDRATRARMVATAATASGEAARAS